MLALTVRLSGVVSRVDRSSSKQNLSCQTSCGRHIVVSTNDVALVSRGDGLLTERCVATSRWPDERHVVAVPPRASSRRSDDTARCMAASR